MEYNIPTIIIGLGGTGLKSVVSLKKKLGKSFDKSLLKFLVIDSDKNEILVNELSPDEYINVGVPGVSEIISNLRGESASFIRDWFPSNLSFKVVSGDEGAKQFRPMGRLYLFKNFDKIYNTVDMIVKSLRAKFADVKISSKTINVYIISSTCGGTGSGMILDVAYMARKIIEEENAVPSLIKGILFLPTAFHPFPISEEAERKHLFANGYATLKEIDYYMNPNIETEYDVQYTSTQRIKTKKPPFDACYIVDDENEEFPIGGIDDTIEAVTESLIIILSSGIGTAIKSAEDNLFTILSGIQKMQPYPEKNYLYSSLGTSSIIYPIEMIKKYAAGRLVKYFFDHLNYPANFSFVLELMKTLKIDEINSDDLITQFYNQSVSFTEVYEKVYQIDNKNFQIDIREKVLVYYTSYDQVKKKVEEKLDEFVRTKFEEFKKLIEDYISNPSVGFFAIYNALTDIEKGLPAYINKAKEMLKKEIEFHNEQVSKLERDTNFYLESLIEKSKNLIAKLFNKKDKNLVEKFAKSISDLSNHKINVILKESAITFYNKLNLLIQRYISDHIDNINNAWQKFYKDYILEYLKIDFESKPSSWGNRINFYIANKEMIDKDIDLIIENEKTRIINQLYKIFDGFKNFDYSKFGTYEQAILNFIEENFIDYLHMDLEDQVVSIFGDENQVINRLLRSSTILYRYKSQLFNDSYVKQYKVLGVKNVDKTRFFNIAKSQNIEVIENFNPYRISMLQIKHGLPLYAFVLIEIMEKSYDELINSDPGLHINPFYQKLSNISLESEISNQDFQKYLYIYLSF
ncbi:MAG: tubulin-like doman-containing protein, partial [bacterium]